MHFIELSILLLALGSTCHAAALSSDDKVSIQKNHLLTRQETSVVDACPLISSVGESVMADVINHFTGIFSEGLHTYGTQFPGPLAAGAGIDLLNNGDVVIGRDHPSVCSDQNDTNILSYGLVSQGDVVAASASKVTVYGNVLYGAAMDGPLEEDDASCSVSHGTGLFDFAAVNANLQAASEYLARLQPDYVFDETGAVTKLNNPADHPNYHVFTLDTCSSESNYVSTAVSCAGLPQSFLSKPSGMIFGSSIWSGTDTSDLDTGTTIVINVPVRNGGDLHVSNDFPTQGLPACSTIFNFFAVDENGNHVFTEDATFNIHREGNGVLEGLVLAPNGRFTAGLGGTFAGKMFAERLVDSGNFGDFTCGEYQGCFPLGQLDVSELLVVVDEDCSTTTTTTTDVSTTTETDPTVTVLDIITVTVTHPVSTGETTVHTTKALSTITETVTSTTTITSATGVPTTITDVVNSQTTVWVPVGNEWPPKE